MLTALVSPMAAVAIFGLLASYYMFEHLPSLPAADDDAAEPAAATERS